jgi:phosphate transport system protein
MPRETFDRELGQLEAEVVLMSGMVENAIFSSLAALAARDLDRSQEVIDEDDRIDDKENDIEAACIEIIRREAPIASDLRRIIAVLHIAGELERIGDYAEGIGKISLMMGSQPPLKKLVDIPRMGEIAVSMLKRSLEAYLERDPKAVEDKARGLGPDDDAVDALYKHVQDELIEMMKRNPDYVERATYLLWVAHNLERVADRATNIAEQALYQATGRNVNIGQPEHVV